MESRERMKCAITPPPPPPAKRSTTISPEHRRKRCGRVMLKEREPSAIGIVLVVVLVAFVGVHAGGAGVFAPMPFAAVIPAEPVSAGLADA